MLGDGIDDKMTLPALIITAADYFAAAVRLPHANGA